MSRDPVEAIVESGLRRAGIQFTRQSASTKNLDFCVECAAGPVYIECKQFKTPRTEEQIERDANVIVIQGLEAARFFAAAINYKLTG